MNKTYETIFHNNPVKGKISTESTSGNYRRVYDYCVKNQIPLPVNRNDTAVNTINGKEYCNVKDIGLPQLSNGSIEWLKNSPDSKYVFCDYQNLNSHDLYDIHRICEAFIDYWGECIHVAQSKEDSRIVVFQLRKS